MIFGVLLPVPPLYNSAVRHVARGAYPTKGYREWLAVANEAIAAAMRGFGVATDTEGHFAVSVRLSLSGGRRGDVDGYLKPVLDALGGAVPDERGRIVRGGLVYQDDRQVARTRISLDAVRVPDYAAGAVVEWQRVPAPADWAEREKAERRVARQAARGVRRGA